MLKHTLNVLRMSVSNVVIVGMELFFLFLHDIVRFIKKLIPLNTFSMNFKMRFIKD